MSIKMQHSLQVEDIGHQDLAYCQEMNALEMLKEVRDQGLPFYKWYKWIEDKIDSRREEAIKAARADEAFK